MIRDTILCIYHNDHTPSMKVYEKFAHCYVCGAHVPVSELGLQERNPVPKPEPTNIPDRLKYIKSLPSKIIRGLQLHFDQLGYYILWPQDNYYKRRNWAGKIRYIGPSGVKAPLLVCPGTASHLVVVEGELNALSLYSAIWSDYKIVSPGSANEFMRFIKYYAGYSTITIIMDYDAPGVVFGCNLKDHLLKMGKRVNLVLMKEDFNEHLQQGGEEQVKLKFEEAVR